MRFSKSGSGASSLTSATSSQLKRLGELKGIRTCPVTGMETFALLILLILTLSAFLFCPPSPFLRMGKDGKIVSVSPCWGGTQKP